MNPIAFNKDRLNRREAAEYLGPKNSATLAVWSSTGRYQLPHYKVGRLVFYRKSDLDKFLEDRKRFQK